MMQLQPQDIADAYTITEINTEISEIKTAISAARASMSDRFDDTQAQIAVKRQKLEDLRKELAVWIKAKNILGETDSSTANFIAADFNPIIPRA